MIGPVARLTWERRVYGSTHRWHLFANETETVFFLEMASAADRRLGHKRIAVCGKGLCSRLGNAATLEAFHHLDSAKRHAENLWREWTASGELKKRVEAGERAWRAFYARHGRQENGEPMENAA